MKILGFGLACVLGGLGVIASSTAAQALTWNLQNFSYAGGQYIGNGSFDYDTSTKTYSNLNVSFYQGTTKLFTFTDANSVPSAGWTNQTNTIDYVTNIGNKYFHIEALQNFGDQTGEISVGTNASGFGTYFNVGDGNKYLDNGSGAKLVGVQSVTAVPFDFSPTEGAALGVPLFIGLGILRKKAARKLTASKAKVAVS